MGEHFVDLGDFPALVGAAAVLQEAVHFVKHEDGLVFFGLGKGLGDELLGFADVFGQQIGAAFVDKLFARLFGEPCGIRAFARTCRAV